MEELIKISKSRKINCHVINARDLHAFLGVGKNFGNWISDKIRKYEFVENEEYAKIFYDMNGNETQLLSIGMERVHKIEYCLTLDVAKELAMVQNNERGRQIRKYFIEVERIYKTNHFMDYLNRMFRIPTIKKIVNYRTYLLLDIYTKYTKIGKSININKRIKYFKTINPSIQLVTIIDNDIELKLHYEYEHKRIIGEWFNLTENDIINIKNKYHE